MITATQTRYLSKADLESYDQLPMKCRDELRYLCPLCGDDKPRDKAHKSLSTNPDDGKYFCQRCKASGMLKEYYLKEKGVSPSQSRPKQPDWIPKPPVKQEKTLDETKVQEALSYWKKTLSISGTAGESYLSGRGLDSGLCESCQVRYLDDFSGINSDGKEYHLGQGVVFPIIGLIESLPKVVGISFRSSKAGNSRTCVRGEKSSGCFPLPGTFSEDWPYLIVTEAPIDTLSIAMAGIPSGVATCGTIKKLPEWVFNRLKIPYKGKSRTLIVATDNDEAGETMHANLKEQFSRAPVRVERVKPPDNEHDWNDALLNRGIERIAASFEGFIY